MRHRSPHWKRSGAVLVQVTIALIVLLGIAAFALDITRLHVAAQHAQAVADGAALAGVVGLPDFPTGQALAVQTVDGNNWDLSYSDASANPNDVPEWYAWVNPNDDVTYYPPGSTISAPDGTVVMQLGPNACGIGVRALVRVTYGLARVLGLDEGSRIREAVAVMGPAGSSLPVLPIWLSKATRPDLFPGEDFQCPNPTCLGLDGTGPYVGPGEFNTSGDLVCPACGTLMGPNPGDLVDLVYDDVQAQDPGYELPYGSFGFLDFSTPGEDWFVQLLRGYDVAPEVYDNAWVSIGDSVTAYPGVNAGPWDHALGDEHGQDDGTARLERAENPENDWYLETWDDRDTTRNDPDPRIMLVPIVEYDGMQGANATFTVVSFAMMWLEEVIPTTNEKRIRVRFLEFEEFTGMDMDPNGPDIGIYVRKLIL